MNQSALFQCWQSCKHPVLATDGEGKVIFCSAAAERKLGLEKKADRQFLWSAFPVSLQGEVEDQFRILARTLTESSGRRAELVLGGQPWQLLPFLYPEGEGILTGWLFVMGEEAVESAEDRVVRALASGVAHDFNNILTGIISHLDLASSDTSLTEKVKESFRYAQASAKLGSELANALMTFSHRPAPKCQPIMLNSLVEEVVTRMQKTLNPRVSVRISPDDVQPFWVEADEIQIRQLLQTLYVNARDAMLRGGCLTIHLKEISFPCANPAPRAGQFARITFEDTGEGLPASALPRLFEPYFCSKTLGKGSGLGLANVRNIAVGHGGWVEVESQLGQGSRFHVYLPLGRYPAPLTQQAPSIPEETPVGLEGSESILVVDDEDMVRTIMRAVLGYRGYRVKEAKSGAEAIRLYAETMPRFDLVLVDVQMPDMNGWTTAARLKEIDPEAACIFLSGGAEESIRERASAFGTTTTFLTKPFDNQVLLKTIRSHLDALKKKSQQST